MSLASQDVGSGRSPATDQLPRHYVIGEPFPRSRHEGTSISGRSVTSSTWDKRRAVLHRAVEFARASGWIDANPLTGRRHVARAPGHRRWTRGSW